MTMEILKTRIDEILKKMLGVNEDGGIEIYTDYRERELSDSFLKEIFKHDNPMEAFNDELANWATDYAMEYGEDELKKDIRKELTDEEEKYFTDNFDEIWEYVKENTYFYYNSEDFNNEVKVNIMVDCGNWNYDCVCDNVLNWYGNSGDGSIDKESSMLWLAKTQGKATALRKACKQVHRNDGYYVDRDKNKDKFIESCIQEFENLPSHMATVTFLVKMPLFDLFDLIELQNKEYDEKGKYDPRKNEKSKSYIVLGKETMCGLYDSWSGGGSVLEVELDKDVKLPIKYAIFCVEGCKMRGYDINEVYGLIDSCWKETVKELKEAADYDIKLKGNEDKKPLILSNIEGIVSCTMSCMNGDSYDILNVTDNELPEGYSMGFNPQFLSDLCITCTEDSLHCEVTNNKSPLYVYEKDYTFLILPVNIIATPEEIITAIKKLADAA